MTLVPSSISELVIVTPHVHALRSRRCAFLTRCLRAPSDGTALIKALVAGAWVGSGSGEGSGATARAKATAGVPETGAMVVVTGVGVLAPTRRGLGSWASVLVKAVVDTVVAKEVEASLRANAAVGVGVMALVGSLSDKGKYGLGDGGGKGGGVAAMKSSSAGFTTNLKDLLESWYKSQPSSGSPSSSPEVSWS